MTPLDDELRQALAARAASVAPAPDPLAGIEARAVRIRRRRVAATVSGAALVVAAVAVAVPLSLGRSSAPDRPAATPTPTPALSPDALPANALDTGDTHGTLVVAGRSTVADAWVAKHPGPGAVYAVTLVSDTSAAGPHLAYSVLELWHQGGPAYAVVAQGDAGSPVLVRDAVLPARSPFIDGVVNAPNGDPYVIYVLASQVDAVSYDRGDGTVTADVAHRVGNGPLSGLLARTGPTGARDTLTATYADGRTVTQVVWLGPNDDHQPPSNLVSWVVRGDASAGPSEPDLLAAYARSRGAEVADAAYQPAYAGTKDGLRFTVGQAWVTGDPAARTVGYATGGPAGPQLFVGGATPAQASQLTFLVTGATTDLLVVVPRIGAGPISYSPDATSAFAQVANGRSALNGIGLVARAKGATADRLRVYDGDAMHLLYDGRVAPLLCSGYASCP